MDKISRLPDEVLLSIISLLTLKEAARTSVLSHRWTELWCFYPILDFEASEPVKNNDILLKAGHKNIGWVNRVLRSYKGDALDEFRVRFTRIENCPEDIDTWVKFAIQKKVKSFTLDFGWRGDFTYSFPSLSNTDNGSFLQKLYLRNVNIDWDVVEHLISFTCPNLEELVLIGSHSRNTVNLHIAGSPVCLKHLKIVSCHELESIRLSATNLLSFKYLGTAIDISCDNVPNLVNVSAYAAAFPFRFPQQPSYLARLETLKLHILNQDLIVGVKFPSLPNLKSMKLDISSRLNDYSLVAFSSLIDAAPSLCRVKMAMRYVGFPERRERDGEKVLKRPLWCLKEIEIIGFLGRTMETELVRHLLDNAIVLEKVIIDCLPLDRVDTFMDDAAQMRARIVIQLFKSQYFLEDKLVLRNY